MRAEDVNFVEPVLSRLGDVRIIAAVDRVYGQLGETVARHQARCDQCGQCCGFAQYGHALFVTTVELIHFFTMYREQLDRPGDPLAALGRDSTAFCQGEFCPLQISHSCGVHAIRPIGCRLFFCNGPDRGWIPEAYETYQSRLKAVCATLCVPYCYVEWTNALVQCATVVVNAGETGT